MKKTKLLVPILAAATIGSTIAPLALLTSCNKTSADAELDASTAKEQTTNDNKTVSTYCFNIKNKLVVNSNDETETEEIEVETEDVQTTDNVTVEVSALQYDPTTGKFYVTITASKEDGTLNDQETVSFSLNLRCVGKKSRSQRWAQKFTHFVIKHSASQLWSGHFNDTDVTKVIKKDDETATKGTEQKEILTFPINSTEVWKESAAGEDEYDLTKLKCYVLQDLDIRHFIQTIKLPDHSQEMQLGLKTGETGQQYLSVIIPYTISKLATFGAKARFTLMFTYNGNTVFQTIGGFSINYVEIAVDPHLILANSREQHYYNVQDTDTEKGSNIISFILDNKATYSENDFTVTSSNERIEIGNKYIFQYETENAETIQILTIAYSIKDKKQNPGPTPRPEDTNIYNVSLTVESKNESSKWSETFKGFSFYKGTTRFEEGALISSDAETLRKVSYKAGKNDIDFTDVLRTCKPFDLTQFTYVNSYAVLDEGKENSHELPFTIESLGWNLEAKEHYSVSKLNATGVVAGQHNLKIYVYVISAQAAYAYCLNVGDVTFSN